MDDMMEKEYEDKHLKKVYKLIEKELEKEGLSASETKNDIIQMRKSIWNTISGSTNDIANIIEIAQNLDLLGQDQLKYERKKDYLNKLQRIKESPYFGRVDFKEKGLEKEEIYIGISSFIDFEKGVIYIYDWRSPVSSIFYEYEIGPARYESPSGIIEGDIYLKRQFKIKNDEIIYMFDSSVKIDDEILQEILGKHADDRMKNIVSTIQREQNKIIRNDKNAIVIVQGTAGSGKTSIALHRIAYLLYKHRDRAMSSDNIVIFSPNQMFNDYISNVLPELGEENINQTTFFEYARRFVEPIYRIEDINEQMEYLLSCYDMASCSTRVDSIKYKASIDFLNVIKNYINYIETHMIKFSDIYYRDVLIISEKDIKELFLKDYKSMPVVKRLSKIRDRIFYLLKPIEESEMEKAKKKLMDLDEYADRADVLERYRVFEEFRDIRYRVEMMTSINIYDLYLKLFDNSEIFREVSKGTELPYNFDAIRLGTLRFLRQNLISYEDVPAYVFFKGELQGVPNLSSIKHVVIDEAQDYTPLQYEIFHQLFKNCSMTILGDLNQSIHPYMNAGSYENILRVFGTQKVSFFSLYKSYRSVREIVEFSRAMLTEGHKIEYINRPGTKPRVIKVPDCRNISEYILDDILKLIDEGNKSISVICKTFMESSSTCKVLNESVSLRKLNLNIRLIKKDDEAFAKGVLIIPSYLSKGLEFDAVIIYDAGAENYSREEERKLFYTMCTRALHRLHIYYRGDITPFIAKIDIGLYDMIEY